MTLAGCLLTVIAAVAIVAVPASATDNRAHPTTWAATDALGRTLPTYAKVGPLRKDRFVGMFYFLWLGAHGQSGPHDITKILAQHPDALNQPTSPPWGPFHSFHHWGEPLFGYYVSDDAWVLRKHAQMLSDAGVDTVIFDVTNQSTYPKNYLALCRVWTEVRKDGGRTPQIAFLCPFGDAKKVVRELYDNFYGKGLYRDLWFIWKGKPLIIADPATVDEDLRGFFTFRKSQSTYFDPPTGPDQWSWLQVYPQHVFKNSADEVEEMAVGVAQNAQNAKRLASMSEPNAAGRSWHNGHEDTRPGAVNLGLNYAEQWRRALEVDPEFVFVTGWNEWVALWLNSFWGVELPVMFVDEFNQEYSRDIEPMRGGHWDNYYYQTVDFIRRYKGAEALRPASRMKTIEIDGRFDDWRDVRPEYRDDAGDTMHRNHKGWGDEGQYINTTGRNDIVRCKVARDDTNVYFYVRTREALTAHTDPAWMWLLINADSDPASGWEGFDYIVNREVKSGDTTLLERSRSGWNWEKTAEVRYKVRGSEMELAIPRAALGLENAPLKFEFKWADNVQKPGDVMEFLLSGDTAPNARFAYRFAE
ncbi:MAG: hypothetical protein IT209_08620 [Armatimonadetes bacterium]|nr:hypothetical protein [Armatimonadota bacterium]